MAAADVEQPPAVPDYLSSPNAVFEDKEAQWRYGAPPDYSKTRKVWEEGRKMNHAAGSLPQLVENLVKNWEVEASFKPRLQDWRTIDHENYTFAINGGPPQSAQHMLKVGTYNAIIAPNEYYSPENSDFASSHKTFKRMMPTFAWEVIEVYSGPPKVAFKWRHWGTMKNDYVGFNDKGEKITAKAHGGPIEVFGVTVAQVDDKVRLQSVDTWFDPLDMFRQIAPHGVVNKEVMNRKVSPDAALDSTPGHDGVQLAQEHNQSEASQTTEAADVPTRNAGACPFAGQLHQAASGDDASTQLPPGHPQVSEDRQDGARSTYSSSVTGDVERVLSERPKDAPDTGVRKDVDQHLESSAEQVHPHPKDMEEIVKPEPGEAVAAPADSEETVATYQEMSGVTLEDKTLIMNRE